MVGQPTRATSRIPDASRHRADSRPGKPGDQREQQGHEGEIAGVPREATEHPRRRRIAENQPGCQQHGGARGQRQHQPIAPRQHHGDARHDHWANAQHADTARTRVDGAECLPAGSIEVPRQSNAVGRSTVKKPGESAAAKQHQEAPPPRAQRPVAARRRPRAALARRGQSPERPTETTTTGASEVTRTPRKPTIAPSVSTPGQVTRSDRAACSSTTNVSA